VERIASGTHLTADAYSLTADAIGAGYQENGAIYQALSYS
jgi:hypothetical protein